MPTDAQHTKAHPKQKSLPSLIKPLLISSIALQAHTPSQLTPLPKNGRRRPRSQADWARLAQRTDPGAAHHRTRARRDPAPHCQCRRSFCEHFRCSAAAWRRHDAAASRAVLAGREIDSEHDRHTTKYIIRFKLAAPDRTLAPSEQRALLALRALDKELKWNQTKQTRFTTRMLPAL